MFFTPTGASDRPTCIDIGELVIVACTDPCCCWLQVGTDHRLHIGVGPITARRVLDHNVCAPAKTR